MWMSILYFHDFYGVSITSAAYEMNGRVTAEDDDVARHLKWDGLEELPSLVKEDVSIDWWEKRFVQMEHSHQELNLG